MEQTRPHMLQDSIFYWLSESALDVWSSQWKTPDSIPSCSNVTWMGKGGRRIAMDWNTRSRHISWIKSSLSLEYFRSFSCTIELEKISCVLAAVYIFHVNKGLQKRQHAVMKFKVCSICDQFRKGQELNREKSRFQQSRQSVKKKGLTEFKHRWMKFNLWTINFHIESMQKAKQPAEMRFTEVLNTVWW